MRPVASFLFRNTSSESKRLCLFPGHFVNQDVITQVTGSSAPFTTVSYISHANPNAIKAAGFECDQVADDFNLSNNFKDGSGATYAIEITPKTQKGRYRDFLNFIKLASVRVSKMRITDLTSSSSHDIFQSEIEISKSSIGSKSGSDFIQLSAHIDPSNYLQNFIEIDLEQQNLLLDETTLAFIEIPGRANFQIDFTLA